jgi:fermentation-respiration switch protein FrsA (DUF1100 family)
VAHILGLVLTVRSGGGFLWRRAKVLLVGLAIAYALILLFARIFETRLIFFPDFEGRLTGDWRPKGLIIEEVWLKSPDETNLHAWWIPNPRAAFTFVAFHGNAGNISQRTDVYRFLSELPVNILAIEYRGYGRSDGKPSEAGLYLDGQTAYDYLIHERGIPPSQIVAFGQSLGTAVAVDLATRRQVAGLVLEAPFPSVKAVTRRFYPFLPGLGLIAQSKFDTGGKLARPHPPVAIIQCSQDPVLAFALGEEVYRLAVEPKYFLRIDGYCHEEASIVAPTLYRKHLSAFLKGLPGGA